MSAQGTARRRTRHPEYCANCGTSLRGSYCHSCGQSVHDPVRHFSHAVEEVFESFWHLDGRIFRTLRDLPFPGRIANRYLGGHRVSYVAPLRLFLVLSVLTFLFAQLATKVAMHGGGGSIVIDSVPGATTPEEVEHVRQKAIAGLQQARDEFTPGSAAYRGFESAIANVNQTAEQRLAELRAEAAGNDTVPVAAPGGSSGVAGEAADGIGATPVSISWLPGFANHWLTTKKLRMRDNLPRIKEDPQLFVHAYLSAVPRTLFVLVPLFALLLKLAYSGSGRLYLEHLVIALYSHAWICFAVLVISLVSMAGNSLGASPRWPGRTAGYVNLLLFWSIPIYLLLMQKLVYRQGWGRTLLKYVLLGSTYTVVVTIAAATLVLLSVAYS